MPNTMDVEQRKVAIVKLIQDLADVFKLALDIPGSPMADFSQMDDEEIVWRFGRCLDAFLAVARGCDMRNHALAEIVENSLRASRDIVEQNKKKGE